MTFKEAIDKRVEREKEKKIEEEERKKNQAEIRKLSKAIQEKVCENILCKDCPCYWVGSWGYEHCELKCDSSRINIIRKTYEWINEE